MLANRWPKVRALWLYHMTADPCSPDPFDSLQLNRHNQADGGGHSSLVPSPDIGFLAPLNSALHPSELEASHVLIG